MPDIEVSPNGLQEFARVCGDQAATVNSGDTAPTVQSSLQASAAAVRAVHLEVTSMGEKIARRLETTGGQVSEVAAGYWYTDSTNAARIDAVRAGMRITEV